MSTLALVFTLTLIFIT